MTKRLVFTWGNYQRSRKLTGGIAFDKVKPETFIVFSRGKFPATREAGSGSADTAHPREMPLTVPATISVTTAQSTANQWQGMTGRFARNSKVATGFAPFPPMGQNPSPRPGIGQQMSQLVAQRAVDFGLTKFLQGRIQQYEGVLEVRAAHRRPHAMIPIHSQTFRQIFGVQVA